MDSELVKNTLKWTHYDEDVLPGWGAEMDFGLAPAVNNALHDAIERGDTGYPAFQGMADTAAAATGFWASRLGWTVAQERVVAVHAARDGQVSLSLAMTLSRSPGLNRTWGSTPSGKYC